MTNRSDDALVELRGICKSYDGDVLVVKDLNLDIRRGEFLTLLGPSGSGKTTILMMLAGFETPTYGDIRIDGHPMSGLPPHKRNIGVVFQSYALFPHMTVAENLAFPLEVRKTPRDAIRDKVKRALAMVRLDTLGNRHPSQLSGGQQQRVALARALVFEPKLVLMDEPLGALDKQLREQMQLEIKHIHESLGVTVVYVTHDQSEALTMSDRVAVMDAGIIQQIDAPDQVYEAPTNSFVAHFIGENNRLPGKVVATENGTCVVEMAGWTVRALAVRVGGVGSTTTVSLRPEKVRLADDADGCFNRFTARVREVIYMGDHTRLRLELLGIDDFIAKVPHNRGQPMALEGDEILTGFTVEDCRALDAI